MDIPLLIAMSSMLEESMESSSSSGSEEEELIVLRYIRDRRINRLRIVNYVENVLEDCSDAEFKVHFRMTRDTVDFLLSEIRDELERQTNRRGQPRLPARKQLLITLWVMATPVSYRSVCDRFNVGRATAVRSVRRVTKALNDIAPRFITWPQAPGGVADAIETRSRFPGVVGAIDGTHIHINAPRVNPEGYVNRKGRHSIQLQVICDHDLRFIHCYTGQPGSVHDQRVFRLSNVQDILDDDDNFPPNGHILGDAAYNIQKRLLVPYKDNGHLTPRQKNFNFCLSSARMIVERSIGLLKCRFRSLLDRLPMTRIDLIPEYIIACCVLHNVCLLRNDMIDLPIVVAGENAYVGREPGLIKAAGIAKRNLICNTLQIRDL